MLLHLIYSCIDLFVPLPPLLVLKSSKLPLQSVVENSISNA